MTTAAYRTLTVALAVLSLALTAALILNRHTSQRQQPPEVHTVTDTLIIRDTVHIALPTPQTTDTVGTVTIPVTVPPDRHTGTIRTDTTPVTEPAPPGLHSTPLHTDTIYIRLPIEQRYYTGPHYEAWISGHRPRLDSLRIRTEALRLTTATTVTRTPTATAAPQPRPERWGIGIHLGYGMTLAPQPQLRPYIGIGISYNILTF